MTSAGLDAGHDAPKCGADTRSGGTCGQAAGWGTDHVGVGTCKLHLGSTENHRRAAQREIAQQAVIRFALVAEDIVDEIDPRDSLALELARCHLAVEFLGRLVNDLAAVYGDTYHVSGIATGEAKPHVLWVMWVEERKHLKAVAAEAARAGVEARRMDLGVHKRIVRAARERHGIPSHPVGPRRGVPRPPPQSALSPVDGLTEFERRLVDRLRADHRNAPTRELLGKRLVAAHDADTNLETIRSVEEKAA